MAGYGLICLLEDSQPRYKLKVTGIHELQRRRTTRVHVPNESIGGGLRPRSRGQGMERRERKWRTDTHT